MPSIVELTQQGPPSVSYSGASGASHAVTWQAKVDAPVSGDHCLALAQELIGTLPAGAHEVPNPGARLFVDDNGICIPDTGQTVAAHATANPNGSADAGAYALDFDCSPIDTENRLFEITATYRPPQPGARETPAFVAELNYGGSVGSGGGTATFTAKERWLDFEPEFVSTTVGRKVTLPDGASPTFAAAATMVLPNKEAYPPVELQRMSHVLVIQDRVTSPQAAVQLNRTYQGTTNSADFTLFGETVPKLTAEFLHSQTGQPQTFKNSTYYVRETRVALRPDRIYLRRPSFGSYYLDGAVVTAKKRLLDEDGFPIDLVPLTSTGELDTSGTPNEDVFALVNPVSYAIFGD